MCAWPIAVISCVRVPLRRASSGARIARAPATSRGRRVVHALQKRLSSRSSSPRQAWSSVRLVHQRGEHGEVLRERPGLGVEARELAALEAEGGRDRLRAAAPTGCSSAQPNRPLQAISTPARAARPAVAAGVQQRVGPLALRAADQPLRRLAVEPQRRLRVGHQQQVDLLARPRLAARSPRAEPPRRPQRPELHAQLGVGTSGAPRRAMRSGPAMRIRSGAHVSRVHERLRDAAHLAHPLARVVGNAASSRSHLP